MTVFRSEKTDRSEGAAPAAEPSGRATASRAEWIAGLVVPLVAAALQGLLWPWIQPYVWFCFFPAVFFSARIGGFRAGIAASLLSVAIVWYVFMPPHFSFAFSTSASLASVGIFLVMGFLFSETQERLRRANARLAVALTESRATAEKISQLYERTLEVDRARSALFARVSHELRTPLALILAPVQQLLARPEVDAALGRDLEVVERNALVLRQQIDDLLEAARLESRQTELRLAPVDLSALVRSVAAEIEPLARGQQIDLLVEAPADLRVEADGEKLQRVLLNLLSNALKAVGTGGKVVIRAVPGEMEAVLEVEDDGPGVPIESREAVFEPFRQLSPALAGSLGGTGLGLAIVRELVGLHGGRVSFEDGSLGGARAVVRLPRAGVVVAPPPASGPAVGIDRERVRGMAAVLASGRPRAGSDAPAPAAGRTRILVVEDHDELRHYLADAISPRFEVLEARDGAEGLARARERTPDLVITDLMMPGVDGEAMIAAFRAEPALSELPILVLTARDDAALRIRLLREGVQCCLGKPFQVEEVLARVETILRERSAAAGRLRESEARFEVAFEQAAVGMALVALDGRWLRVNEKLCAILGYSKPELLATTFQAITVPEDLERDLAAVDSLLVGEHASYSMEKRYRRRDGGFVWANLQVALLRRRDGSPECLVSVVEDISARKRAEDELQTSAAALREAQHLARLGSWDWDLTLDRHRWSEEIFEIYGRDRALPPAVYPEVQSYFTAASWAELARQVERAIASGEPYECEAEVVRPDGRHAWVIARGQSVRDGEGRVIRLYGTVQDVTARRLAEEALRKSEAQLRTLFDEMAQGVAYQNARGEIESANPAAERILGLSLAQLQGRTSVDPRWRAVREDGSDFPGHEHPAMRALSSGQRVTGALMGVFNPDDERMHWLKVSSVPVFRATESAPIGVFSTFEDVTELREAEAEIRRLHDDLERRVEVRTAELSAANRELDAFSYAVSHDLRTPLRALSGFSRMLAEEKAAMLDAEGHEWLERIDGAARRMAELIDGLLVLSRSGRGEIARQRVDLSGLVEEVRGELERAEPGREVIWSVESGLVTEADPGLVGVVMRNLLGNAWKYTSRVEGAEIRVAAVREDGRLWIAISDNGAGFDPAHAARLFEPFRRLHREDEFPGLGIGLATVQRIVRRHGGAIRATGEPGHGATFTFTLGGGGQPASVGQAQPN